MEFIIKTDFIPNVEGAKKAGLPELIRCKDCKHLIDHPLFMDDGYCEKMRNYRYIKLKPDPNWYCADGERKEGDVDG